jgi:hypothetical protein
MIPVDELLLCSPETRDRYERDRFAFDVATKNLMESWRAVIREAYAASECADARGKCERTDT